MIQHYFLSAHFYCKPSLSFFFASKLFEDILKSFLKDGLHMRHANDTNIHVLRHNDILQCLYSSMLIRWSFVDPSQDVEGLLAFSKFHMSLGSVTIIYGLLQ